MLGKEGDWFTIGNSFWLNVGDEDFLWLFTTLFGVEGNRRTPKKYAHLGEVAPHRNSGGARNRRRAAFDVKG